MRHQHFVWVYSQKAGSWLEHLDEVNARWLGQLPFSISIPSHRVVVVHAGNSINHPIPFYLGDIM